MIPSTTNYFLIIFQRFHYFRLSSKDKGFNRSLTNAAQYLPFLCSLDSKPVQLMEMLPCQAFSEVGSAEQTVGHKDSQSQKRKTIGTPCDLLKKNATRLVLTRSVCKKTMKDHCRSSVNS